MDNDTLLKAMIAETASKIINNLSADNKEAILTNAVENILRDFRIGYQLEKTIEDEAIKFAKEYMQKPDVQRRLKEKAINAVEEVMDGLAQAISKKTEQVIRDNYIKWVKDKD
ncbi:hypothetical protein [Tepidanaerobacter syntrophicus]|uniref:Uncharacterized protein n=1 Tax=Tepidanaerobacter syntrophicus TaxID=224999 RepID=A0A0U9HC71_9FIRM|nr:hypothetical protein [Tepidanaerobacter syntrophicus]GAQ24237.1 hypothetical protein TSYNT_563 [Tepidanaerobacter syntrophicus]